MNNGDDVTEEVGTIFDRLSGFRCNDGNVQTIVHQGIGKWGPAAITACFCTLIFQIMLAILFFYLLKQQEDQIRDLQAWMQVYGNKVSTLEAKSK